MTEHERIWLEPAGAPDRCWCQDNQWGDEGVEYVLASSLEGAQAEENRLRAIALDMQAGYREATARAEAAEAEVKRLSAPVTIACRCTKIEQDETCPVGYPSLLCERCDGKGVLPYVELDGPELWEIVFGVNDDVAGEITDEQYDQIAKAINDVFIAPLCARQALASTGGEHNAE